MERICRLYLSTKFWENKEAFFQSVDLEGIVEKEENSCY